MNRFKNAAKIHKFTQLISKERKRELLLLLQVRVHKVGVKNLLSKKFKRRENNFKKEFLRRQFRKFYDKCLAMKEHEHRCKNKIVSRYRHFMTMKNVVFRSGMKRKPVKLLSFLDEKNLIALNLYFKMWKNKVLREIYNENGFVLTKFMKNIMDRINYRKRKSLFFRFYQGIRLLKNAINRHKTKEAFDEIKNIERNKAFYRYMKKLAEKIGKNAQNPFNTLKRYVNYENPINKEKINDIQRFYRKYRARRALMSNFVLFRRLRFILRFMGDKNLRILNKAFKVWARNGLSDMVHTSARAIQHYVRQNVFSRTRKVKLEKSHNLQKMFNDYYFKIILIKSLKRAALLHNYSKAVQHVKRYALMKFFLNIKDFDKRKNLFKLFRLPETSKNRLLSKYFKLWRENAKIIAENKSSNLIQKNFRLLRASRKAHNQNDKISKVMKSVYLRYADKRAHYFAKWRRSTYFANVLIASTIITSYFMKKLRNLKAVKRWKTMSERLRRVNYLTEKKSVNDRLKEYGKIYKLSEGIKKMMKRDALEKLKQRNFRRKIVLILKEELPKHDENRVRGSLYKYFNKWKNITDSIRQREIKLDKFVKTLNTVSKINSTYYIDKVFTVKKFLRFKELIEKAFYFKKLKKHDIYRKKITILKETLVKANKEIETQNVSNVFLNSLYKVYTYRVLSKLKLRINNLRLFTVQKNFQVLRKVITEKEITYSNFQDKKQFESTFTPKTTSLSFKSAAMSKHRNDHIVPYNDISKRFLYLSPFLFELLRKLYLQREQYAFDKIKNIYRIKKFMSVLQRATKVKDNTSKFKIFITIHKQKDKNLLRPHFMKHMRIVFRKYLIYHFVTELRPLSKLTNLLTLIKITLMHNVISDDKYNAECLTRWKVLAHMKMLTKKNLKNLYYNMQSSYQNVAQELFGDHEKSPGMIKEFGHFGEKISHVTNQKLHEQYYLRVVKKFSDTQQSVQGSERESVLSKTVVPRKLVLDNLEDEMKDNVEYEIMHTEPLMSNKSKMSEISFKSEDSAKLDKPANNQNSSSKKGHKPSVSGNLTEKSKAVVSTNLEKSKTIANADSASKRFTVLNNKEEAKKLDDVSSLNNKKHANTVIKKPDVKKK